MTLKKSSVNPFRFTFLYTLKKSFWIPLALLLYNSYSVLAEIVSFIYSYNTMVVTEPERAATLIKDNIYILMSSMTLQIELIWSAIIIFAAVATAAVVFRFMMNKSAVNVWYSFGMTRTKLFLSKYLAGAFALSLSALLPIIVSFILNMAMFGSSRELWLSASYLALTFLSRTLIFYSIAACTFCGVGTMIEGVFFSLVYCVTPAIAEWFVESSFSDFVYGSPLSTESWTNSLQVSVLGEGLHEFMFRGLGILDFIFFPATTDFANASQLNRFNKFYVDFSSAAAGFIILALIILIAVGVNKKRKTEIAGFLGSNPLATGVVVFTSAILVITFLMQFVVDINSGRYFIGAVYAILVFAIIYLIADAISLHNFKLIIKKLWKFPIHLAIFFGCILVFTTGLFGYSSRRPDTADIKSVSISTNTADSFVDFVNNLYASGDAYVTDGDSIDKFLSIGNNSTSLAGGFTNYDDICRISEIHKKLINCKKLDATAENACAPYEERVVPVNIGIIYTLKNGKTVERMYHVATEEILSELADLTLTERYRELAAESLRMGKNNYRERTESIYFFSKFAVISPNMSNITHFATFGSEDIDDLLDTVASDVENGSLPLNFRSDAEVLAYLKISREIGYAASMSTGELLNEAYSANIHSTENEKGIRPICLNEIADGVRAGGAGIVVPVYSDMTNTVAFLEEKGLTEYFEDAAQPVEARIWALDKNAESQFLWDYGRMTSLVSGFWSNGKTAVENATARGTDIENDYMYEYFTMPKLPDNAKIITDSEEIEKLQNEARMLALTCYDGAYVQFIFEDGSMTFGYIPA